MAERGITARAEQERELFEATAWPLAFFGMLVSLVLWLAGLSAAPLTGMAISGGIVVVTVLLVLTARRGHVAFATTVFSLFLFVLTAVLPFIWGGTASPNAMMLGVAVLVAGLLRGWRLALISGLAGVAVIWGLHLAEEAGLAPVYPVSDAPEARAVLLTGYLMGISLYLGLALRQRSRAASAERLAIARATEREEQLLEARRLESVGRLAGGIAHDFGNLLTVILGNATVVVEDPVTGGRARELVGQIREAGERAAELTRQLLAVARRQVSDPRVIDLVAVANNLVPLLRRLIREDVQMRFLLGDVGRLVRIDPAQLEQIVVNLVVNAADAMPEGGELTVEVTEIRLDQMYAEAHVGVVAGPHVALMVTDTGMGMDELTVQRVFEPFFSTKGNEHSGLGLASVHGIVKQAGGHIFVYSEPGRGTTVKVFLPRAAGLEARPAVAAGDSAPLAANTTVMVVDDEPLVRHTTSLILETFGCRVLTAASGAEAIEQAASHAGVIDLLITDVVMPRMSGQEIAAALRRVRPALRVLFVSGYAENAIVHHGELDRGVHFLGKPFMPEALREKMQKVMQEPVGGS